MKKVIFSTELTPSNEGLRNHILSKLNKYKNTKECNLIDIGCGNGRFAVLLHDFVKSYSGIDPDKEYLLLANREKKKRKLKNVTFKLGSAGNISFDKKFDIVLYTFSFHFIKEFNEAMKELSRITKDDSIILIVDPSENKNNWSDPRLNKNSPLYVKEMRNKKIIQLKRARKYLESQKQFKIIDFEKSITNFWTLKK